MNRLVNHKKSVDKNKNIHNRSLPKGSKPNSQHKQQPKKPSLLRNSITPRKNKIRSRDPYNKKSKQNVKKVDRSLSSKSLKRSISANNIKIIQSKEKLPSINIRNKRYNPEIDQRLNRQKSHRRNSVDNSQSYRDGLERSSLPQIKLKKQLPVPKPSKEEKDIGLLLYVPPEQTVILRPVDITDDVYEKYLQMVSNDNDTNYVMNALPQLQKIKKEDDTSGRDFISGRISKLSGVFDSLNLEKILTPLQKIPSYYRGNAGRNLKVNKIVLVTKFKVPVDIGFVQYSLDQGSRLTVFRIYISKIYRRMNYLGYVYLETFKGLIERHSGTERWSMFIMDKNVSVHKFFKYLGFKIEKVVTDSQNKKDMDYFQEFHISRKDLVNVLLGTQLGAKESGR